MISRFGWHFQLARFTPARVLAVVTATMVFALARKFMGDGLGNAEDLFTLAPLLLAAWFWGRAGGIVMMGIILSLHFSISHSSGTTLTLLFGDLSGIIGGFVITFGTGWLSDLLAHTSDENAKRKEVEKELRILNERLEQRVLDRTIELYDSKKMAERAKKEWETTVDALSDLIVLTDEQNRIVRCNHATISHLKKDYSDVLQHSMCEFFNCEGAEYQAIFNSSSAECQFQNLAGWYDILNHQVKWDDGKLYYVHIIHNITARKQIQAELQAERDFALTVVNTMGQGLTVLDKDRKFEYVNPAYARMLGYSPEELKGRSPYEFTHEEYIEVLDRGWEQRQSGETTTYESELRRRDGATVFAHITGVPRWSKGKMIGAISVVADLTEIKRAESALRESETLYRTLIESSPVGIWRTTFDTSETIYINPAMCKLLGVDSVDDVMGHSYWEFFTPASQEIIQRERSKRTQNINSVYEVELITKQGTTRPVLISGAPIFSGEGKLLSSIGTFIDLSEIKQMQTAIIESQKMADLGTLAAGVAHEMNSPLQVITGVSQMVLRQISRNELEIEQLQPNLEMINRNSWRCAEIVRSLRTYAHVSTDAFESVDLNEIIRDTLLLTEHQLKSWSNIAVVTMLKPDLPAMKCNRNQIAQVLINMLTNARDAMPNGGEITLSTNYDSIHDRVSVDVSDTGSGIPDSIIAKIYDPFFTTKPIGQGTGLGLSIVVGILRAHGGEIQVTSSVDKGTKFTMSFPLEQVALNIPEINGETIGRFDDAYMNLPLTHSITASPKEVLHE